MAFVRCDGINTCIAVVAEVEVERATGRVKVRRIVVSHDCGVIINPDGLKNQIEGNVIQAVSRTLKEEVKFDRGGVSSLDWDSYPILTFEEVPEVEIVLIDRPHEPALGVGEASTAPVPAAIANAIFDATECGFGKRLLTLRGSTRPSRLPDAVAEVGQKILNQPRQQAIALVFYMRSARESSLRRHSSGAMRQIMNKAALSKQNHCQRGKDERYG